MTDELSEREQAWVDALARHFAVVSKARGDARVNTGFSRWAAARRLEWERANVVWYYGTNGEGKAVWGRERPKPELLKQMVNLRHMNRTKFLESLAKAKGKR